MWKDIVEALNILAKYNPKIMDTYPSAEHDQIWIASSPDVDDVSGDDVKLLEELHVHYDDSLECWYTFC